MDARTNKGYILLSRSIIDSPIVNKPPEYLKAWIFLLEHARFKDDGNLKKGQGFTSLGDIAEFLSYYVGYRKVVPSKKQVWGIIEWLRSPCEGNTEGNAKVPMIETTKVTHGFVYTICKYELYQDSRSYEGNTEGNDEGTTKELRKESGGNNKYKKDNNVEEYKQYNIYGDNKEKLDDIVNVVDETKPKRKAQSFVKPTKEEVAEYANEIGFNLDAGEFIDSYEAKGWMVGRTKMKDWKAAVRNWKRNKDKFTIPAQQQSRLFQLKDI